MKYYILNDKIVSSAKLPNPTFYVYDELSSAEIAFYLANPTATAKEVKALKLTPIPEISLSEAKLQKIAELEAEFQKETNETGVIDTTLGYTVRGRYLDLLNVIAIQKSLELNVKSEQFIFDINNAPHVLNLSDINTIFTKFVERGKELYVKLETLKATVNSKLKVTTVQAVVW